MRRSDLTPQSIAAVVDRFCARAAADEELAPLCCEASGQDGTASLRAFWTEVLLGGCSHDGDPLGRVPMPPDHPLFERWLGLFRETAAEVLTPELAALFNRKAERLGEALQTGMWFAPGGRRRPCTRLGGR